MLCLSLLVSFLLLISPISAEWFATRSLTPKRKSNDFTADKADPGASTVYAQAGAFRGHAGVYGNKKINRYTVPFAKPPVGALRFANPQPIDQIVGVYDASELKSSCYQLPSSARGGTGLSDESSGSEDCLYLNIYTPNVGSNQLLPILVHVHGGSFQIGSSTANGLDGSRLAAEQGIVVVTLQYRLGIFGWLQTGATLDEANGGNPASGKVAGNQAVRDVLLALQWVQDNIKPFGGDASQVTLQGQSSGAHMIRAIFGVPSAKCLFDRAILASDTFDYGGASAAQNSAIGEYAMGLLNCANDDLSCARAKSAADLLSAGSQASFEVPFSPTEPSPDVPVGSIPVGEPWRPFSGQLIASEFNDAVTDGSLKVRKPIIITTVSNEAGSAIGLSLSPSDPGAQVANFGGTDLTIPELLDATFNQGRGDRLAKAKAYRYNGTQFERDQDGLREYIERVATDGLWTCAADSLSAALVNGGDPAVYRGHYTLGIEYSSNAGNSYCEGGAGRVCHEDDLLAMFGTYDAAQVSQDQIRLSKEVMDRFGEFVRTGSPNPQSQRNRYSTWSPLKKGSLDNLLVLGPLGKGGKVQTCRSSGVWGKSVKFDWQLY